MFGFLDLQLDVFLNNCRRFRQHGLHQHRTCCVHLVMVGVGVENLSGLYSCTPTPIDLMRMQLEIPDSRNFTNFRINRNNALSLA